MDMKSVSSHSMEQLQAAIESAKNRTSPETTITLDEMSELPKRIAKSVDLPKVGSLFQRLYGERVTQEEQESKPILGTLFDAYA